MNDRNDFVSLWTFNYVKVSQAESPKFFSDKLRALITKKQKLENFLNFKQKKLEMN